MLLNQLPVKATKWWLLEVRGTLNTATFLYPFIIHSMCLLCTFIFTLPLKTDCIFAFLDTQLNFYFHSFIHSNIFIKRLCFSYLLGAEDIPVNIHTGHCFHGDYSLVGKHALNINLNFFSNYKCKNFIAKNRLLESIYLEDLT